MHHPHHLGIFLLMYDMNEAIFFFLTPGSPCGGTPIPAI
jgi:hypothetical protein